MNRLIGSDIEFAARHRSTGLIVPAGLLPIKGKKGNPDPLNHGGVEIDCCGVEITPKAGATEDEFVSNILGLKSEISEKFPEYDFLTTPSHYFRSSTLRTTPQAMTMGCDPDFCAWNGKKNPTPRPRYTNDYDPGELRTFGGHIHVEGGTRATVVAMDFLLGMWSLIASSSKPEMDRRRMYGMSGAYREKPYGIEYRVLSNFWAQDEATIRRIYRVTNYARNMTVKDVQRMVAGFPFVYTKRERTATRPELEVNHVLQAGFGSTPQRAYIESYHEAAYKAG